MKVQAHSSLESPLEYNQDQTLLTNLENKNSIFGVTEILCSFTLVLEEKAGKEKPQS